MEHETTALTNLRTSPSVLIEKIDIQPTEKKLTHSSSSHSSSPDSLLDDPFLEYDDKSSSSSASSPKKESDPTPHFQNLILIPEPLDPFSASPEATTNQSSLTDPHFQNLILIPEPLDPFSASPEATTNQSSLTEPPPIQVMDPPKSKYRIPSSVFARSKSNAPVEWSTASNESLFSIQMGNMSFINDPLIWKPEDTGSLGEASTSTQMFSYTGVNNNENSITADTRSRELGLAEATMKEVIRESENQNHHEKPSISVGCVSHRSDVSNTSTKSFAFSQLGAEVEKGASMSITSPVKGVQEHSKPGTPPLIEPQTVPAVMEPAPQSKPSIEPKPLSVTGKGAQYKWFSCC